MSKDSSAKYYQNSKDRLKKKAHEKYQSLSKEEKEKKQQYGHEWYENLPEKEEQKLVEYRRRYKIRKMPYYNYKKLFSWRKSSLLSASIFERVWIHF